MLDMCWLRRRPADSSPASLHLISLLIAMMAEMQNMPQLEENIADLEYFVVSGTWEAGSPVPPNKGWKILAPMQRIRHREGSRIWLGDVHMGTFCPHIRIGTDPNNGITIYRCVNRNRRIDVLVRQAEPRDVVLNLTGTFNGRNLVINGWTMAGTLRATVVCPQPKMAIGAFVRLEMRAQLLDANLMQSTHNIVLLGADSYQIRGHDKIWLGNTKMSAEIYPRLRRRLKEKTDLRLSRIRLVSPVRNDV